MHAFQVLINTSALSDFQSAFCHQSSITVLYIYICGRNILQNNCSFRGKADVQKSTHWISREIVTRDFELPKMTAVVGCMLCFYCMTYENRVDVHIYRKMISYRSGLEDILQTYTYKYWRCNVCCLLFYWHLWQSLGN